MAVSLHAHSSGCPTPAGLALQPHCELQTSSRTAATSQNDLKLDITPTSHLQQHRLRRTGRHVFNNAASLFIRTNRSK